MEPNNLIHPRLLLKRTDEMTLNRLVDEGIEVVGRNGAKAKLRFVVKRPPFIAQADTGWEAVKVRSPFGEDSILLYEGFAGGRVSGILRIVRPLKAFQRSTLRVGTTNNRPEVVEAIERGDRRF